MDTMKIHNVSYDTWTHSYSLALIFALSKVLEISAPTIVVLQTAPDTAFLGTDVGLKIMMPTLAEQDRIYNKLLTEFPAGSNSPFVIDLLPPFHPF